MSAGSDCVKKQIRVWVSRAFCNFLMHKDLKYNGIKVDYDISMLLFQVLRFKIIFK